MDPSISKFYNKKHEEKKKPKFLYWFISKVLICIILFLSVLIAMKVNPSFKETINKVIYENNFSFNVVNNLYKKYLGNVLPFDNILPKSESVFDEVLEYEEDSTYKNGVLLKVSSNYLTPALESGVVVFIGNKEQYGNTIVVEQTDGVNVWYGNIVNTELKMYDYIEKGSLIGECLDNKLYLVFQKEGKYLNYKDYI